MVNFYCGREKRREKWWQGRNYSLVYSGIKTGARVYGKKKTISRWQTAGGNRNRLKL
ncbi:MAG: hypothetical protein NZ901_04910 [Geminocystis sp.]|nr:hypothetical protein [Geminocystis sp.]HIK37117.1 hypothetical protein [Geminocystis sp. M7585_C2015_104]MCS7147514.1 hypothetical protein [Geminocystis sp.]MCX8077917.1 hypothetical protein [Geminocystis sp.]MDW8115207.1 hypothetical protein [Geminocystis sp.]